MSIGRQIYYLDGVDRELALPLPLVREFDINPSWTCDETVGNIKVYDHNSVEVTASTEPWYFDGTTVHFIGTVNESMEGKYFWPSIDVTYYLMIPGEDEPEEEEGTFTIEIALVQDIEF